MHKLGEERVAPKAPYHGKVAKTKDELRELIAQRTPVWEFVLYGSVLYQGREDLRPRIRDHSIGYAPWNGKRLTDLSEALFLVRDTMRDLLRFSDDFNLLLSPDVHVAAFGEPGQPGDPERIIHLGERFVSIYEQLLNIAADLRGMQPHPDLTKLVQLTAKLTDQPLADLDKYIDQYVATVNDLHEKIMNGEEVENQQMVVEITLDDEVMQALNEERERLQDEFDDDED